MVAEDEGLVALLVEEVLLSLGCRIVGPASRLEDLKQLVEAREYDGALLDINLRGQHVFEVLPRLQEFGVPFIVTSGYDAKSLFPPRFHDVPRIAKPFDEASLRRICLEIFARAP